MTYLDPDHAARSVAEAAAAAARPPRPAMPKTYSAFDLRDKEFPPVRFAIEGLIPQGLTLLAGKPKIGKSWLMLDFALAVATGGQALGRDCQAGNVLYAALEDHPPRIQWRLDQLADRDAWPRELELWHDTARIDEGGGDQLMQWIESRPNARLIIVDVYTKVRRQAQGREGNYDADYAAGAPLKKIADQTGVPILLVHHKRKQPGEEDPIDGVSGSTGLTGVVDTVVLLDRDNKGCTLMGRGRDIEEYSLAVRFDPRACRWESLGDADQARMSEPRLGVLEVLKAGGGEMKTGDIARAIQRKSGATCQILGGMVVAGLIERPSHGVYRLLSRGDD